MSLENPDALFAIAGTYASGRRPSLKAKHDCRAYASERIKAVPQTASIVEARFDLVGFAVERRRPHAHRRYPGGFPAR